MISQLSQRDRIALAAGGLVVLATVLYLAVFEPYREGTARLDAQIATRQRQLQEVQAMRQDYLQLQQRVAEAEKRLDSGQAFSLFSFVEGLTAEVAAKGNLVYMRPQPAGVQDDFKEESVEIKLEKIRLDQVVNLLYRIDTAKAYLKVKNLRLKPRFDDRTELDAVLTISSFRRNA
ncbi:MAG: hypothetical protein C0617_04445 [Desulfuromonas sp.]|uniref:type II secretion system protein GspM n=1 Tax=Desulfuromonas sp. TaxID=892 RepID=UPI000CB9889D|nr:type II secretion system protein GspM [Desulfuromonas sp.]PLX85327.1 MAG: hypothetical protein C0617_04445 [Desulfuromonas sp.]